MLAMNHGLYSSREFVRLRFLQLCKFAGEVDSMTPGLVPATPV